MSGRDAHTMSYKEALQRLCECALACASPHSTAKARKALREACKEAFDSLSAPEIPEDFDYRDAEKVVTTFIEAGGKWSDLTASVSRHQLEGATRKHGRI